MVQMDMTAEVQCELFEAVLDEIGNVQQLVNEVIEVDLESLDRRLHDSSVSDARRN
jgi:hypothetical protein